MFSDISINSSHTESNLASVEAKNSDLPSQPNALEDFCLRSAVEQQHNDEEHRTVIISRLPDIFEVVETHSIEACSCNSVPERFQFWKKVHYFLIWHGAPCRNRDRPTRSFLYLSLTLSSAYPIVLLVQLSGLSKHALISKNRLRNSEFISDSSRHFWARKTFLIMSSTFICWFICSLYGKSYNFALRNFHIVIWWTPISRAGLLKRNVRSLKSMVFNLSFLFLPI